MSSINMFAKLQMCCARATKSRFSRVLPSSNTSSAIDKKLNNYMQRLKLILFPIAISDDEESDIGELSVPLRSTRERKPMSSLKDGDDMAKAVRSGSKNGDNDHEEDNDIEEEDEEEDPMDLEEDECVSLANE